MIAPTFLSAVGLSEGPCLAGQRRVDRRCPSAETVGASGLSSTLGNPWQSHPPVRKNTPSINHDPMQGMTYLGPYNGGIGFPSLQDNDPFMSCSCTLEDYLPLNTWFEKGPPLFGGMVIFSRVLTPRWESLCKGAARFLSNFSMVGSLRSAFWTGKLVDFQLKLVHFTFKLGDIGRFSRGERSHVAPWPPVRSST